MRVSAVRGTVMYKTAPRHCAGAESYVNFAA